MELGVVFPQTEIGNDPGALRDFAQAAEGMGFGHLLIYDHVLGADPDRPGGWNGPYTKDTPFHEVFVTLGYLAALTSMIELATAVVILPQRQTALVAKQVAEIDLLSGGRFRFGVGTGWNEVEYEALGENFHNRGKRQEEQIALMRELWTKDALSFEGRWHRVTRAGINPRPNQAIPIWFGGGADALLDRAGRIGDGWMPISGPNDAAKAAIEKIHEAMKTAGRDPSGFGIQAQAQVSGGDPDRWRGFNERWEGLGATHIAIATMNAGLSTPDDHIDAIRRWKEAVS